MSGIKLAYEESLEATMKLRGRPASPEKVLSPSGFDPITAVASPRDSFPAVCLQAKELEKQLAKIKEEEVALQALHTSFRRAIQTKLSDAPSDLDDIQANDIQEVAKQLRDLHDALQKEKDLTQELTSRVESENCEKKLAQEALLRAEARKEEQLEQLLCEKTLKEQTLSVLVAREGELREGSLLVGAMLHELRSLGGACVADAETSSGTPSESTTRGYNSGPMLEYELPTGDDASLQKNLVSLQSLMSRTLTDLQARETAAQDSLNKVRSENDHFQRDLADTKQRADSAEQQVRAQIP